MILALLLALPSAALAQSACLPHDKMVDLLDNRYSEQRVAAALESNSRLLEVFTSADGATWTMAITTPSGASCVVAAGVDWLDIEPEGDGT